MSERWTNQLTGDKVDVVPGALRVDEASATITYIGWAKPGTAESDFSWRIMRVDESSGVAIEWAGGTRSFDKSWDNRASLTYS